MGWSKEALRPYRKATPNTRKRKFKRKIRMNLGRDDQNEKCPDKIFQQ
jgi:hypothetical protein